MQDIWFEHFLFQIIAIVVFCYCFVIRLQQSWLSGIFCWIAESVKCSRIGHLMTTVHNMDERHLKVPLQWFPLALFLLPSPFIRRCVGDKVTKNKWEAQKKTKWAPASYTFKSTEAGFAAGVDAQRWWFTLFCLTRPFLFQSNGSHGIARNKKIKETTARFLITPICLLNCAFQANRRIFIKTLWADKCFLCTGKWLSIPLSSSR